MVIPPKYGIDYPPLATPSLLGYLKSKGVQAKQVDWNIEYRLSLDSENEDKIVDSPYSDLLPNKPAYDLPYDDNSFTSFHFTERLLASPLLSRFMNDLENNPFQRFILENKLIERIKEYGPGLVGLSIISPSQVIFSFTLGHLLKHFNPGIHLVIGGQWVSLYRKEILKRKDFTDFFDSAIFFEGETPLFKLISELSRSGSLENVPNLIYKDKSEFVLSQHHSVEKLDELAGPDFAGLDLNRYKTAAEGKVTLTFETSRECYWNKCAYCVDLPHPKQGYRARNPRLVVEHLRDLLEKYPINSLILSDPAMSPNQLMGISQEIIKNGLRLSWWCFARLDQGFTKETFLLAKEAGCSAVSFGLETASQRLLDFIQKGLDLDIAKRVLLDCDHAGLNAQLQMMLGLPTETLQDALETINFLVENREIIQQVTFNVYYLTPGCLIHDNPADYGILPDKDHLPFQFFLDFSQSTGGLSKKEAYSLIRLYNILTDKYAQ